jgi:hypothetical protein
MNPTMHKYCEKYATGKKHAWSTVHHPPQTLGKLSAYQKGLKAFLIHRLGTSTDRDAIDEAIRTYVHWHNNGLKVRTIQVFSGGEITLIGRERHLLVRETREGS